jgi:hypothetical protein
VIFLAQGRLSLGRWRDTVLRLVEFKPKLWSSPPLAVIVAPHGTDITLGASSSGPNAGPDLRASRVAISTPTAVPGRQPGKHLPLVDVASAGGWKSTAALLRCYMQPDEATLYRVASEPVKLRRIGGQS